MANIVRSDWTTAEILNQKANPGPGKGVTSGSWIDDLAVNYVTVLLCDGCEHKWDAKKHDYHKQRIFPGQRGFCRLRLLRTGREQLS